MKFLETILDSEKRKFFHHSLFSRFFNFLNFQNDFGQAKAFNIFQLGVFIACNAILKHKIFQIFSNFGNI